MKKTQKMKSSKREILLRHFSGSVQRNTGENAAQNRFTISFSSEEPCVNEWGDQEVMLHTAEAVNLERLRETGALLFAHGKDENYGRVPIGGLENIQLDENRHRCTAEIVLDEDDPAAMIIAGKIAKGYLNGVSVGAAIKEAVMLRTGEKSADGRHEGPVVLITKWEPFEISVEPTPADSSVGIGRSAINKNNGGNKMFRNRKNRNEDVLEEDLLEEEISEEFEEAEEEYEDQAEADEFEERSEDDEEELERVEEDEGLEDETVEKQIKAERKRAAAITKRCRALGVNPQKYIERGYSVHRVNDELLRHLSNKKKIPAGSVSMRSEQDKFRSAASDSILLRGGVSIKNVERGATELRGMRLRDLAAECLQRSGKTGVRRYNDDQLFRAALSPDSAFVGILTDAVSKTMAVAYQSAPPSFEQWASEGSNPDFKPKHIFQISEAGDLEEVTQNGEIKMDHPTDSVVTSSLATFAKVFGFDRKALINDDIDMLTKIPTYYVRSALRGVNKAVYKILSQNPVMEDGNRLFSAGHNNLSAAAKPTIASYQEAMGKMMAQKGLRGLETLNIRPAFVLCNPMQYAEHSQLLYSTANPEALNSGAFSPFNGMMQLIMDAEIEAEGGIYPYFFASSPDMCGTIEVSYLNGVKEPTLEYEVGFDYLGIKYRIVHDRGVSLLDYRGLSKNPGL